MMYRIKIYLLSAAIAAGILCVPSDIFAAETAKNAEDKGKFEEIVQEVDSAEQVLEIIDESDMVSVDDVAVDTQCEETDVDDYDYSLRRVLLYADDVEDTYGASNIIHYGEYNYYVYAFDTEEETAAAYSRMIQDFGSENCELDEVLYADNMMATVDYGSYSALGWGCTYMGMDVLKAQTDDYGLTGEVRVAVIDSGINASDDLFDGRIDTANSYNFYSGNTDYSDDMGHGTHVAGIIADSTPDNVKLTIMRAFQGGNSLKSNLTTAVQKAIDLKVDVINMSFCFYSTGSNNAADYNFLDALIERANEEGVVMCVAAGNTNASSGSAKDVAESSYPANKDGVIAVSALARTSSGINTEVKIAGYSYYGDTIDFAAPGSSVVSTWNDGTRKADSGTSMATPYISAAAAYVRLVEPDSTNADVENCLRKYCIDLGDVGKDKYYGYGCPYMAEYYKDVYGALDPEACTMLSLKNTANGLKLSWSSVQNASGYRIYRRSTTSGYVHIADIDSKNITTYTDALAASGQKYRYKVTAVNSRGEGESANSMVTMRLKQPKLVVKNGKKGIVLKWDRMPSAKRYVIYRKAPGETAWKVCARTGINKTSYTDTKVKWAKIYTYTVKAVYNNVVSSYDPGQKTYRMSSRTIKSVTSKRPNVADVEWNTVTGITGYQLQYSYTTSFAEYKLTHLIAGQSVSVKYVSGLTSGKWCYIRVRSYKKVGSKIYYGGWGAYRKVKIR